MTVVAQLLSIPESVVWPLYTAIKETPIHVVLLSLFPLGGFGIFLVGAFQRWKVQVRTPLTFLRSQVYILLHLIAPKPRAPFPSEKTYLTTNPDGTTSSPKQLPCWYDRWLAQGKLNEKYPTIPDGFPVPDTGAIEPAEVEMSVVIPAYNEEERLVPALEEMVEYLDKRFGRNTSTNTNLAAPSKVSSPTTPHRLVFKSNASAKPASGYEIILVNDGSRDRTVDVALEFSKKHGLHDILRVVTLEKNRGKGGGVTHGFRHVRGEYAIFADADGASKFSDLGKLVEGVEDVVDGSSRGVAIGSRAHLVGSEAVVKVCLSTRLPS